ncbi:MarR family winged helix-turn-helix transcriptional regulator [Marinimicrobium agarilyticum]|uniref:MarR family winged helix-turn-helix transcriptional regulator n=1 Tax=Marinimicrobium agarilyticum TaxID=306546 RepID=UPI0004133EA6|nr:MarR family transcriptional regulator [Marinimicrobium agarilyticum]
MSELHTDLPETMRQVLSQLRRNLQARLDEQQLVLSLIEAHILHLVESRPGITALEITQQSGYDKALIARKIKALEEADRLNRQPDPNDHRRHHLHLTKAGQVCCEGIAQARKKAHGTVFRGLSRDEQQQLNQLLGKCLE